MGGTSPPPNRRIRNEASDSQKKIRRTPPPLDTSRSDDQEATSNMGIQDHRQVSSSIVETGTTSATSDVAAHKNNGKRDNDYRASRVRKPLDSRQGEQDEEIRSLASMTNDRDDASTDFGFEVSMKSSPVKNHQPDFGRGNEGDNRGEEGGSIQDSSVVFSFSGIRDSRSKDLIDNGERAIEKNELRLSPSNPSTRGEEYKRLLMEVERIMSSIPISETSTPKAKNNMSSILERKKELPHLYSRGLTSIYSIDNGDLSTSMHARVMSQIRALTTKSTLADKEGIVQELFKMGIRVRCSPTRQDSHRMGQQPSQQNADYQNVTNLTPSEATNNENFRPRAESLSSEDVDERWEAWRTKFLQETPNSSSEIDNRWESLRETSLQDDEESSPTSLTSEMENDLIRDCVETGLPSPRKAEGWEGRKVASHLEKGIDSMPETSMISQAPTTHIASTKDLCSKNDARPGESIPKDFLENDCNQYTIAFCTAEPPSIPMRQRRGQPDDDDDNIGQPLLRRAQQEDDFVASCQPSSPLMVARSPASPDISAKSKADSIRPTEQNMQVPDQERRHSSSLEETTAPESETEHLYDEMDEDLLHSSSDLLNNRNIHDASEQTVSSCLTGDGEDQRGSCDSSLHSANFASDKPMRASNHTSCASSTTVNDQGSHHDTTPFLHHVLSSETASGSTPSVKSRNFRDKHHSRELTNSSQVKETFEGSSRCPRIEVMLVLNSSRDNSRSSSDNNISKQHTADPNEENSIEAVSTKRDRRCESSNGDTQQGTRIIESYRPPHDRNREEEIDKLSYDEDVEDVKKPVKGRKKGRSGHCDESIESGGRREADIIDISSSLTRGTDPKSSKHQVEELKLEDCKPVLRKSTKPRCQDDESHPTDLSVGFASCKSAESRKTGSPSFVPGWRLPGPESLSDVTLRIVNDKTGESTNYYIHKHMVAVGVKKSEYLDERFRTERSDVFQLSLDDKTSQHVPNLLDFMYCHDYEIDVSTENVVALLQLGKLFKVIPVVTKAAGFILEDMTISNMSTYVSESCLYKDEKVKKVVVSKCSENIQEISVRDPLWAAMEPQLFLDVLSSPSIQRESLSLHLSILLKEYIEMHQYEIDDEMFIQLTSENIIPTVDREAALPLIELCEAYDLTKVCEPLLKRCAYTVASHWQTTTHENRHRLFSLLRNLPSSFTVDFLEIVDSGTAIGQQSHAPESIGTYETACAQVHPDEIVKVESISLADLCDDLVGVDGYAVSGGCDDELSWRMSPEQSYSDWSLRVKHSGHKQRDVYHVHKYVISNGLYRSDFFANLFRSRDSPKSGHGNTTIELDHKVALAFPEMLDFIYSPDHHVHVTHSSAVVLRFLARVFQVSMLSKRVLQFVNKSISLSNVLLYIKDADDFDDDKIKVIAARLCTRDILSIEIDSHLLKKFKPDFFAKVVSSSEIAESARCHVTILITKYFSLHNLDETILGELLSHIDVPQIDHLSALKLLKILSGLEKAQEIDTFDRMQRRCAKVLTENWNELRENHREEMFSIFPLLHPKLLTDIFDVIDHQYRVQHYESMALQSRLVKRYRAQVAEANKLREQEVALLRRELESRTAEMLSVQQTLQTKLGKVNESLNRRTVRSSAAFGIQLPNVHAHRDINSGHNINATRFSKIPTIHTKSSSKNIVFPDEDPELASEEREGLHEQREQPSDMEGQDYNEHCTISRSSGRRSSGRRSPSSRHPSHSSYAEETQLIRDSRKPRRQTDHGDEAEASIGDTSESSPLLLGSFLHCSGGGSCNNK